MARPAIRRMGKLAAIGGMSAVIAVLAVVLAGTFMVDRVTRSATSLDEVDLAIGSVALVHSTQSQAVAAAVSRNGGIADDAMFGTALAEARASLAALDEFIADPNRATSWQPVGEYVSTGADVLAAVEAGALDDAREMLASDERARYAAALATLTAQRGELLDQIARESSWTGRIASALQVLVAIGIPTAIGTVGWLAARRRARRIEEQRRLAVEAAAEQVKTKDEMLVAVSHRFRTPLTSIYGLSEVLTQPNRLSGLDQELASLIHAEAADLYRIADDVLAATQLAAGAVRMDPDIVAVADVIDSAVKPMRAVGVQIEVSCAPMWIVSDQDKIRQVVRNLLSNAAAHGEEPILVKGEEVDGHVRIAVTDHGRGPTAEDVFEDAAGRPRADRLGLAVAEGLTEVLGGTLERSVTDESTTFTLHLSQETADDRSAAESVPVE